MTTPAYNVVYSDDFLAHHGVKGQKWGIRNYQNEDGSYTAKGRGRYNVKEAKSQYKQAVRDRKTAARVFNAKYGHGLAPTSVSANKDFLRGKAQYEQAEKRERDARIKYRSEKRGGTEKALKNAYRKELHKYGLPNSYKDASLGGKGSKLITEISKKHGEEFANDILKKEKKVLIGQFATSAAVAAGMAALDIYLIKNS